MENISQELFKISLEEEDEGGIVLGEIGTDTTNLQQSIEDPKLCLVGKFLTEGVFDFPSNATHISSIMETVQRSLH